MSDDYVTRAEFNGMGNRIENLKETVIETVPKVNRNGQDIQNIFSALAKIPGQNKEMTDKMAKQHSDVLKTVIVTVLLAIGMGTWAILTK